MTNNAAGFVASSRSPGSRRWCLTGFSTEDVPPGFEGRDCRQGVPVVRRGDDISSGFSSSSNSAEVLIGFPRRRRPLPITRRWSTRIHAAHKASRRSTHSSPIARGGCSCPTSQRRSGGAIGLA